MPATAAGRTVAMTELSSVERFQDPFQRADYGLPAHAFPVAGEAPGLASQIAGTGPTEAHRAHRLLPRPAAGPCDAGDGERNGGAAALERAARHLARRLFAHGTVALQRLARYAEELVLCRI